LTVHRLWPDPGQLTDAELEDLYAYPPELTKPWVQVNFVSSADGAVTVEGRSNGLSGPGDKLIFALGRDLADVVLVGAGTARAERYQGVKHTEVRTQRRARLGLAPVPPIAVVTASANLDPESPLIAGAEVPTIVFTCADAPIDRRKALADAGADVVIAGEDTVDVRALHAELGERGLPRVCCEGGPTLFGELVSTGLVDQLCLTVAPLLAGGGAGRIVSGSPVTAGLALSIESVLRDDDGFLMLRYRRT
jgi:5-amino-6-(5-phosphoribosylamino)uracil reductase